MTEEELSNTARIKLSAYEHEFGEVKDGDILKRELTMTNTGKSKLIIYDVKTDCGCTATTLGRRKLDPGEHVKFRVVFHTKNRVGIQAKEIKFTTNDPTNKEVVYTMKANVLPKE